ncbi:MAG TPA: DUF4412 domain-containing protein [Bacteroidales bacterium]|nr:DUF4412 domain-containing protein [Bacteroidales bacterium]
MMNFLVGFLVLVSSFTKHVEHFEGKINIVQTTLYDTSFFTYYVKGCNVRVDKFDKNNQFVSSLIINLQKEEVFVVSPVKKMYSKLTIYNTGSSENENYIIKKTENCKIVNGYECYQWRIKNIERNTEVAYWVLQNDFYFFDKMVSLLARTEDSYAFFEKIPGKDGFFPMLSVERTLLRREKSRTAVVEINKKPVEDNLFIIPSDYELVLK